MTHEWADRIDSEQIDRVLELGEFLMTLPAEQKPLRMTLVAAKLTGDGVARSQEEAYVMLMEACVHHEIWKLMDSYDEALAEAEAYLEKIKSMCYKLFKENQYFRSKLGISATK